MDTELFAVPGPSVTFVDVDSAVQFLLESDSDCDMSPITNINMFLLDRNWRTVADGYTLTSWAMDQICRTICPGLNRVIGSMTQDLGERDQALELYNRLVRSRFANKLDGRQVFVDNKSRTVEGVVGNNYKQLQHSKLFDMLVQSAEDGTFEKLVVTGRWITARFRCDTFSAGWNRGWYISSNDVGAASVKVRATLWKPGIGTVFVPAATTGTVRHTGKTVQARIANAFSKASDGLPDPDEFAKQVLERSKLLVPPVDRDGEKPSEIMVQLANKLADIGLPPTVVKRAIKSVALRGYGKELVASSIAMLLPSDWDTRDQMLLVRALCRQSSKLSVAGSERVLTVAYRVLAGEFSFY